MGDFSSALAPRFESYLSVREDFGYASRPRSLVLTLMSIDRMCAEHFPSMTGLSKEAVLKWLERRDKEGASGFRRRSSSIRSFAKYLVSQGDEAYVLPEKFAEKPEIHEPLILADQELAALFRNIDLAGDAMADLMYCTLFRLMLTCGLRPVEARLLQVGYVDLQDRSILIKNGKKHKDRMVYMSDDMAELCRRYAERNGYRIGGPGFFFRMPSGEPPTRFQVRDRLKAHWAQANPGINPLPVIRPYDLRHNFATRFLKKKILEGADTHVAAAFLQQYMGHAKIESTMYYVHLMTSGSGLPEGLGWDDLNDPYPEVIPW